MTDTAHAFPATELGTEAADGAADQHGTPDLVEKVTHEVDTDDMFVQGGE